MKRMIDFLLFLVGIRRKKKSSQSFKPLVTVLIPAYNEEETIGDTILSVQSQSYPIKEIIVIDDSNKEKLSREAFRKILEKTIPIIKKFLWEKAQMEENVFLCWGTALCCWIPWCIRSAIRKPPIFPNTEEDRKNIEIITRSYSLVTVKK